MLHAKIPLWLLTTWRRKAFESMGSRRFSLPSTRGIQEKLDQYFSSPGFFVEAGAVDGFFESNTYYLERFRQWDGVLVEPVWEMFNRIRYNRANSRRFHCILGTPSQEGQELMVHSAHAMSKVVSSAANVDSDQRIQHVQVRTLTSILDEVSPSAIDLLSLDVEGYEIEVLKGLDFNRWRPRYMLIECLTSESKEKMDMFLAGKYECIDKFTFRDYFYRSIG